MQSRRGPQIRTFKTLTDALVFIPVLKPVEQFRSIRYQNGSTVLIPVNTISDSDRILLLHRHTTNGDAWDYDAWSAPVKEQLPKFKHWRSHIWTFNV